VPEAAFAVFGDLRCPAGLSRDQTAFYARWLGSWRHFHTTAWKSGLRRSRRNEKPWQPTSTGDIRRDFDLSRVGDEQQRRNLSRKYVETTDKLRQLDGQFRLLETAKGLGIEWQEKL
jgi:hypothetical protein